MNRRFLSMGAYLGLLFLIGLLFSHSTKAADVDIQSLKSSGQYAIAEKLLLKKLEADSQNLSAALLLSQLYLHELNNPDKAISVLTRAKGVSDSSAEVWSTLGEAYEKKRTFDEALSAYHKARSFSKDEALSSYNHNRIRSIQLTRDHQLIRDWYVIGPFDNADNKGLEISFPPEGGFREDETYQEKETLLKWSRPFDATSFGFVDFNQIVSSKDFIAAYAFTHAYSPKAQKLQIRLGSSGPIAVWVNNELVLSRRVERKAQVDDDVFVAQFREGWNELLVKVTKTSGDFGFFFRVTGMSGHPIEEIFFEPTRDDLKTKLIYEEFLYNKRLKTRGAYLFYGLVTLAILLFLFLAGTHLYNRVRLNRMKSDFISSVSHELKSPISAIKVLTETLSLGRLKDPNAVKEYYESIVAECDRLTRFINSILDFSKIEKGKQQYDFQVNNPSDIGKKAVEIFEKQKIRPDLCVHYQESSHDLPFVRCDYDAMVEVLLNLLQNAEKYSPERRNIWVDVKADNRYIVFQVADEGAGIPKEEQGKIFERFYRGETETVRQTKGTGLGLSIVKHLVEAHDGKIRLTSQVGKGTTFSVMIPIAQL